MNQKGSQLIGGAVTEEALASSKSVLAASRYTSERGLQQFFTPPLVSEWIAKITKRNSPVFDPTAGGGNLLRPHSDKMRYGVEIDKDWTGKDCTYDVLQGDLQEIYPMARRIGLTFPLILANPPFGLTWKEPTFNDGKSTNSTVLCYQYSLNLLDEYGQGALVCGTDRLDREILPRSEAEHIYAIVDVPDLFGGNVDLPCSIAFFMKDLKTGRPGLFRTLRNAADLDEELVDEITSRRNASGMIFDLSDHSEVQRLWNALKDEYRRSHKSQKKPEYTITLRGNQIKIRFRAFQEIALHRHDHRLLQVVRNLDGLNPSYFAVNRGFWKDISKLLDEGYVTISPDAKGAIEKILQDAELSTCPLYPIKPQQRLGFLTDAESVLCTKDSPEVGLVKGNRYPVFARSRVATERGRKPKVTLSGEVEMQDYKKTRKVLEIKVTPEEEFEPLHLTESEQDIQFLLEHFDMPDPGDLGTRFPDLVEMERERLDRIARRYGFQFRNFQKDDLARLLLKGGGVLCWEQGCGKTLGGMA
ncbi:MAG: SAM-dependent DNA methyltransferase, partial [Candidatus Omnitrophica bacterium]|nr:SAM-dependent DNA methyltransferase [Candidatus Omnitrophota bacterium]